MVTCSHIEENCLCKRLAKLKLSLQEDIAAIDRVLELVNARNTVTLFTPLVGRLSCLTSNLPIEQVYKVTCKCGRYIGAELATISFATLTLAIDAATRAGWFVSYSKQDEKDVIFTCPACYSAPVVRVKATPCPKCHCSRDLPVDLQTCPCTCHPANQP